VVICKKLDVLLGYYKELKEMDFALKIAPSTGLRNILVHEYQKIDDGIVFKSINNVLSYYLEYIEKISAYLGCRQREILSRD